MSKDEISIVPFDMKYLDDYYNGFNAEITKFQWPDPFNHIDDARTLLLEFLEEMQTGKTLLYSQCGYEHNALPHAKPDTEPIGRI